MVKPTNKAEWGTGAAPITEPLLAEKQSGWPVSFKPPAQWFNWWMNLVHLWIVWLDAFESTAHTWSALQTFTAGTIVSSFGVAPGTPGLTGTNALDGGTAIFGSTSAGAGSAAFRGSSSHVAGLGAVFSNSANGTGLSASGGVGARGDTTWLWGLYGYLAAGGTPQPSAAGVYGESAIAGRPAVFGVGESETGADGGHFWGADAGTADVTGGVGLKFKGGSSSTFDGGFNAGNGMEGSAGDATGDASLGYASNAGKNTLRGGNVDGLLNDQGLPGVGLELTGGSVTNDSHNRLGATALKLTGGTGQAGRGLSFDALGDGELNGNIRLTGASLAANAAQVNQLSPGLIVKAWARIRIASGTYSLLAGQNVASVVAGSSPSTGRFKLNLASSIPRVARSVIANSDTGVHMIANADISNAYGSTDTVLEFQVSTLAGAGVNLSTNTVDIHVLILGLQ